MRGAEKRTVNAVDTNVLIRYLINDDPKQSPLAIELVAKAACGLTDPLWIGFGVVLEMIWVLGSRYRVPRDTIIEVLDRVLHHSAFKLESPDVISEFFRQAPLCETELDDLLLGLAARQNACDSVFTFDRLAAKNPLYKLVRG